MAERHAVRHSTEEKCSVDGCGEIYVRTVSAREAKKAGLQVDGTEGRVHLCKAHYRIFKKATRKDREIDRLTWQ